MPRNPAPDSPSITAGGPGSSSDAPGARSCGRARPPDSAVPATTAGSGTAYWCTNPTAISRCRCRRAGKLRRSRRSPHAKPKDADNVCRSGPGQATFRCPHQLCGKRFRASGRFRAEYSGSDPLRRRTRGNRRFRAVRVPRLDSRPPRGGPVGPRRRRFSRAAGQSEEDPSGNRQAARHRRHEIAKDMCAGADSP